MKVGFVTSLLMTFLLAVSATAEGKRVLIIMKSQDSYRSAKAVTATHTEPGFVFEMNTPSSVRRMERLVGKIEMGLDRIQSLVAKNLSTEEIQQLRDNPNVALVEEEVFHALPPKPFGLSGVTLGSSGSETPAANRIPLEAFKPGAKTPWGIPAVRAMESWSVSKGGKGARVMVLDTGIDKDHPSIAANFEAGQDFVGDKQPDYPFNDTHGHGTHCAGTIAGIADSTGFTGVAPEARLLAGRVCGEKGCSNIAIAQGVNWAVEKKVDVISMSLGGMWSTPAERMAITAALKAGIVVIAASGNGGNAQVSYPAALNGVIAVGAIDDKLARASFSQYGPELAVVAPGVSVASSVPRGKGREANFQMRVDGGPSQEVMSTAFQGSAEVTSPVENTLVAAGLGKVEDFAKAGVKGKFAFIYRGEITFADKVKNAMAAGAAGVVISNNVPGALHGVLNQDGSILNVPVFGLDQVDGDRIRAILAAGSEVRTRMVVNRTDYATMDGTSMATPHVAGVAALVKSVNKGLLPSQVAKILRETAKTLGPNEANQYGSGLVVADAAVARALVTTAEVSAPVVPAPAP